MNPFGATWSIRIHDLYRLRLYLIYINCLFIFQLSFVFDKYFVKLYFSRPIEGLLSFIQTLSLKKYFQINGKLYYLPIHSKITIPLYKVYRLPWNYKRRVCDMTTVWFTTVLISRKQRILVANNWGGHIRTCVPGLW